MYKKYLKILSKRTQALCVRRFKLCEKGFTLAEVMVAVGIFSIASVLISAVYLNANSLHQNTTNLQRLQNDGRYMMEKMTREIRARELDYPVEPTQPQDYLNFRPDEFGDVVSIRRGADPTSLEYIVNGVVANLNADDVEIVDIKFYIISGDESQWGVDPITNVQSRVTMFLKIKNKLVSPRFQREIVLQTTVSSKVYKR